jgi:hypothetical protein
MKKRLGFVYMLVMVLALGVLFTGCENAAQQVEFVPQKANTVSNVKVVRTIGGTTANYVIVSWDAASNVTGYTIHVQQEGKKTVPFDSNANAQNRYTYSEVDGSEYATANPDIDKWSALVPVSSRNSISASWTSRYTAGQRYRFGVQSDRPLFHNGTPAASDVVWSEYILFN